MSFNSNVLNKLTARELLIMQYYMRGKKYKEISKILDISVCTIKNSVRSVVKKLDANNSIHCASILASLIFEKTSEDVLAIDGF